jgi:hypothetical protein
MPYFLRPLGTAALLWLLVSTVAAQQPPAAPAPAPTQTPAAAPAPAAQNPSSAVVGDRNNTLTDRLPPDQIVLLEAEQDKFVARYIADLSGEPRGAVLILHDSGQHPSWPLTVAALIDDLPLHGWSTLSIELPAPTSDKAAATPAQPAAPAAAPPAPAAGAAAPPPAAASNLSAREQQAQARIAAGLRHLTGQQQTNIAVIGFGSGAYRAAEFVRQAAAGNTAPITALTLIAPLNQMSDGSESLPKILPATGLPALDLVLSSEPLARSEAELRRRAVLHQRTRIYQQVELPPINSDTRPGQSLMVKRVRGFLQQHAQPPAKK